MTSRKKENRSQSEKPVKSESDESRDLPERRLDKVTDRVLRMIEAVLTYVEANAIDYDGVWLDEGCEEDCEEFMHMYIDERIDVDPPSFNAKHPRMRISHFPNIVRNYLNKHANPILSYATVPCIHVIATSPNNLLNENGEVSEDEERKMKKESTSVSRKININSKKNSIVKNRGRRTSDDDESPSQQQKKLAYNNNNNNSDDADGEQAAEQTTASLKLEQAKRILTYLTPLETTVLARLLVHMAALHHRACFNGLVWRNVGIGFAFLFRILSNNRDQCAHYAEKTLEFFITNLDALFESKTLELFGKMTGNDSHYGTVRLSVLVRQTYASAKFRLFPGSPAAAILAKAIERASLANNKRKSIVQINAAAKQQQNWVVVNEF